MIVRIMEANRTKRRPKGSSLGREVRDALGYLYGVPYLAGHPLADRLGIRESVPAAEVGKRLQERLLQAIEELRPAPGQPEHPILLRRYELIRLRYVEAMEIRAVCQQLGVSETAYYRDHRKGLEAIVTSLSASEKPGAEVTSAPQPDAVAPPVVEGRSLLGRALGRVRDLATVPGAATGLERVGGAAAQAGEYPRAQELLRMALEAYRRMGNHTGEARCLERLADLARLQRDPRRAAALYEEGLEVCQSAGDRGAAAAALVKLGQLFIEEGDLVPAADRLRRALLLAMAAGLTPTVSAGLNSLGVLSLRQERLRRAALLFSAGRRLDPAMREPAVEEARRRLGSKAFAVAWSEGQGLTLEQAVAEALEV